MASVRSIVVDARCERHVASTATVAMLASADAPPAPRGVARGGAQGAMPESRRARRATPACGGVVGKITRPRLIRVACLLQDGTATVHHLVAESRIGCRC